MCKFLQEPIRSCYDSKVTSASSLLVFVVDEAATVELAHKVIERSKNKSTQSSSYF